MLYDRAFLERGEKYDWRIFSRNKNSFFHRLLANLRNFYKAATQCGFNL